MITADYIPELDKVFFQGCGVHGVENAIDGTYSIEIDISLQELKSICEKLLTQVRLIEMKEKGSPL